MSHSVVAIDSDTKKVLAVGKKPIEWLDGHQAIS